MNAVTPRAVDNETTENIWLEFSDRLLGFISKRLANPEDAKDILQDVFIKIHTKKHTLTDNSRVDAWIYQLTRNAIMDYYRMSKKNEKTVYPVIWNEGNSYDELINCISPFLNKLPDHEKQLVQSIDLKGVKQKDHANELGLPYSTFKSQVQKARKKLRQMFLDCCELEFDSRGKVINSDCSSKSETKADKGCI